MYSTKLYSFVGRLTEVSRGETMFMVSIGMVLSLLLVETPFVGTIFLALLRLFCVEFTRGLNFLKNFTLNFYFGISIMVVVP